MAQHSLMENVRRNTEDWFAVKAAVRDKGVDCPDDTPTADVAGKIASIQGGYDGNTVADLIWGMNLKSGGQYPLFEIPQDTENIGQRVGSYAFAGQTNIAEIIIPNFIYGVLSNAFKDCSNLTKITIKAGNKIHLNIFNGAFDTGNNTFDKLVLLCEGTGSIHLEGASMMYNGKKYIDKLVMGDDSIFFSEFTFNTNVTTPSSIIVPEINDIYYHGDATAWNAYVDSEIPSEIRSGFTNATIHYNYTGDGSEL